MKKIKHPLRTACLTALLASLSAFSGCMACKVFRKPPTQAELWEEHLKLEKEMATKLRFSAPQKKTTNTKIQKQKD